MLRLTATADNPGILLQESLEQERLIGSANQIEAIRSEIDKRDAIFIDDRGGCEQ